LRTRASIAVGPTSCHVAGPPRAPRRGEIDVEYEDGGGFETNDIEIFGFDILDDDEVILVGGYLLDLD
jgi:hypothetical protein